MTTTRTPTDAAKAHARKLAWEKGLLSYKLKAFQRPVYDFIWQKIHDPKALIINLNTTRRFGKTFVKNLVACEFALRNPGSYIRAAAPHGSALKKITLPIFNKLLRDCPDNIRPTWFAGEKCWKFKNGSEYHLIGANDGHEDDARGTEAHLCLIDEGGFIDRLDYLVKDIMMPQLLTTNGSLIIASTPPPSPAHPYCKIASDCELAGNYIHRTIYDTDFSQELVEMYEKACGGKETATFRREYLGQFVIDDKLAIIPEWKAEFVREVEPGKFHTFWHRYEAADLGVRDMTVVLFGYYDFSTGQLVIEDEISLSGQELTTARLQTAVQKKETELGYDELGVYRRVADNTNLHLLNDLRILHGLPFYPTSKESLTAMVNAVRMMVGEGRIIVHPRCILLAKSLASGVWKDEKSIGTEFARMGELGHFDAVAALIYLVRNLDLHSCPVPMNYGFNPSTQVMRPFRQPSSAQAEALRQIFGIKR